MRIKFSKKEHLPDPKHKICVYLTEYMHFYFLFIKSLRLIESRRIEYTKFYGLVLIL